MVVYIQLMTSMMNYIYRTSIMLAGFSIALSTDILGSAPAILFGDFSILDVSLWELKPRKEWSLLFIAHKVPQPEHHMIPRNVHTNGWTCRHNADEFRRWGKLRECRVTNQKNLEARCKMRCKYDNPCLGTTSTVFDSSARVRSNPQRR